MAGNDPKPLQKDTASNWKDFNLIRNNLRGYEWGTSDKIENILPPPHPRACWGIPEYICLSVLALVDAVDYWYSRIPTIAWDKRI